jgi:hypothetical protein
VCVCDVCKGCYACTLACQLAIQFGFYCDSYGQNISPERFQICGGDGLASKFLLGDGLSFPGTLDFSIFG